jgi:riboflavin kinase / FMN adenylyltransferase
VIEARFLFGQGKELATRGCVVTAGTFDGVHLGHLEILTQVARLARERGAEPIVITYDPHPRQVLFPEQTDLKLLTTLEEKRELIAKSGISRLLVIEFTREFSRLSWQEYIDRVILTMLGAQVFVLGHDHQFGQGRGGSFAVMEEYAREKGLELVQIAPHLVEEIAVSSSKIRGALTAGAPELAMRYLGRPYSFAGLVVDGLKLGRQLGYPTLNIAPESSLKLLPKQGVYAVRIELDGRMLGGMMNIGANPTISGKGWSCEVHVFDFNEDVYGKLVRVEPVAYLRDEMKFASLNELKAWLGRDEVAARSILNVSLRERAGGR